MDSINILRHTGTPGSGSVDETLFATASRIRRYNITISAIQVPV